MPTFSSANREERDWYEERINRRTDYLIEQVRFSGEWLFKLVSMSNAGGAVATLSYYAAVPQTTRISDTGLVLLAYLIGLGAMILFSLIAYYRHSWVHRRWISDVGEFYRPGSNLEWRELNDRLKVDNMLFRLIYQFLGWTSLVCFVVGTWLGVSGLLVSPLSH